MRKIIILSLGLMLLTGCSIYKVDIRQGNVVDKEQLDKLQLGMTQQQVKFLLGTALLQDTFHQNRWDYIYTFTPGGEAMQKERITLLFENGKLSHIDRSQYTGELTP